MKLIIFAAVAFVSAIASKAAATPAFDLKSTPEYPLRAHHYRDPASSKDLLTLSGDCGGREVSLQGVRADDWSGWRTQGELTLDADANRGLAIRGGPGQTLAITDKDRLLDDFIRLRCTSTRAGDRLILWISGTGSMWGKVPDDGVWYVIDPQQPVKPVHSLSRRAIRKAYGVMLNHYGDTIAVDPPNASELPNATPLSPPADSPK